MAAVKRNSGRSGQTSLKDIQASGRTFYKPSTRTPQQLGVKSDAQIAREAAAVTPKPKPTTGAGKPTLSAMDRYTQMIQGMLTSGSYNKPYDDLLTRLNSFYGGEDGQSGAKGRIGSAMDNLTTFLQGQANPYAGLQAQTAQTTPALNKFLQSQGVSDTPLGQYAEVVNAQNAGAGTAFQNLANTLGGIYGANQAGQISDVGVQRTDLLNQLEQSRLGYGAQLAEKGLDQRNELLKLLMGSVAKGGKPKAGELM